MEDGSTTLAFFALLTKVLKLSGNEGQHVGLLSDLIDRVKQAPRRWDRMVATRSTHCSCAFGSRACHVALSGVLRHACLCRGVGAERFLSTAPFRRLADSEGPGACCVILLLGPICAHRCVLLCCCRVFHFGREKYNSGARDYILSGLLELLNSLLLSLPGARANVGSDGGSALVSYLMDDVLFHKHTDPGTGHRG